MKNANNAGVINNPYAKKGVNKQKHKDEQEVCKEVVVLSSSSAKTTASASLSPTPHPNTPKRASALVIAASDKAGMEGIDRSKIDEIILRVSGNSLYMQQQRKRDEKVDKKIAELQELLRVESAKNPSWKDHLQQQVDQEIPAILSKRPARSICVVVDMDMFYMACELLTRPDLADKPACVGGNMISTSNYVARKYGVRSAMAGYIGDKLVQELSQGRERLIHVPHNFELYRQKSAVVRGVLAEYDPALSAYSLDEAFVNLGPYLAYKLQHPDWDHDQIKLAIRLEPQSNGLVDSPNDDADNNDCLFPYEEVLYRYPPSTCIQMVDEIVKEMRRRVFQETGGLTCSAGVAPNFMLAKIASDRNKPNGQLVVGSHHDQIIDFLHPLPTRKVNGIGRVQEKILSAFMIFTVRELYEQRALVRFLFQPTTASNLLRASIGCSSCSFSSSSEESGQKGISRERTFQPEHSWSEINSRLVDIGQLLSEDMQKKDLWAHTVMVKVKLHTYDVLSKSRSMSPGVYIQGAKDLVETASELLNGIGTEHKGHQFSIRLLGIRCSNFGSGNHSLRQSPSNINVASHSPVQKTVNQAASPLRSTRPRLMTLDRFLEKKPKPKSAESSELTPTVMNLTNATTTPPTKMDEQCKSSPKRVSLGDDERAKKSADSSERRKDPIKECVSEKNDALMAPPQVSCPVCGKTFQEDRNLEINQHIDACLNGSVIRQALLEESKRACTSENQRKKKRRVTDFFSSGA